jgi:putative two-component system response regulator
VADVFDALISRRPYKEPMSSTQAMSFILQGAGSHFDPEIVTAFKSVADQFQTIALELADE